MLAPKYKTVIVVDLQEDTVRPVIVPDYFQSVLDTCGGFFPRRTDLTTATRWWHRKTGTALRIC